MTDTVDNVTDVEVVEVVVTQVVTETVNTIDTVETSAVEVVVDTSPEIEVLETQVPEIVAEVVEVVEVITEGLQGPPGVQGPPGLNEDDIVYSKRIDVVSDLLIYRGEAEVGSAEDAQVWRLRRLSIGLDGDISEQWANGSAEFVNAWVDRATLAYV